MPTIELATVVGKIILLLLEDTPKERRTEALERWCLMWEPFWKTVGLEIPKPVK